MLIKTLPVGHLETNCYVVTDEQTLNCAVIDPGEESNTILDYIESNHLKCKIILLTHGHYDHVGAVNAVAEETGAKGGHEQKRRRTLFGRRIYALPAAGERAFYDEGDVIELDSLRFEIFATPGHTPGGVSIRCGNALFTGDTLFKGSCGRTDFPGRGYGRGAQVLEEALYAGRGLLRYIPDIWIPAPWSGNVSLTTTAVWLWICKSL